MGIHVGPRVLDLCITHRPRGAHTSPQTDEHSTALPLNLQGTGWLHLGPCHSSCGLQAACLHLRCNLGAGLHRARCTPSVPLGMPPLRQGLALELGAVSHEAWAHSPCPSVSGCQARSRTDLRPVTQSTGSLLAWQAIQSTRAAACTAGNTEHGRRCLHRAPHRPPLAWQARVGAAGQRAAAGPGHLANAMALPWGAIALPWGATVSRGLSLPAVGKRHLPALQRYMLPAVRKHLLPALYWYILPAVEQHLVLH